MLKTYHIAPGVRLRHIPDSRFYQECMSVLFLRPVTREETAKNALLTNVLLRGCESAPDLQAIARKQDMLYGAGIGPMVLRGGDILGVGVTLSLLNRGDMLARELEFLRDILTRPVLEEGVFRRKEVESEKENLIAAIADRKNNRDVYAMDALMAHMCRGDSFALPRLGDPEDIRRVTPEALYAHYRRVLAESPVEILYVGSAGAEVLKEALAPIFAERQPVALPESRPFSPNPPQRLEEIAPVVQGRLCLGFTTPITVDTGDFVAMKLCNTVLGGGLTSKLFTVIREQLGLCYSISSDYHGKKGLVTVFTGIEFAQRERAEKEILGQLARMQAGEISETELRSAKAAMLTALQGVTDSPHSILSYYTGTIIGGGETDLDRYRQKIQAVTVADVRRCAQSLCLNTTYFLKGEPHENI